MLSFTIAEERLWTFAAPLWPLLFLAHTSTTRFCVPPVGSNVGSNDAYFYERVVAEHALTQDKVRRKENVREAEYDLPTSDAEPNTP